MHRRVHVLLFAALFAWSASTASAQLIRTKKVHRDPNVRQVSCAAEVGGVCAGGCGGGCQGAEVLPGACGCAGDSCGSSLAGNTGPCGAGGCAGGGCSTGCYSAPFGFCLYQNDCSGGCGGCCKSILSEMAMDVRRWSLGRRCGGCGRGGLFGLGCICGRGGGAGGGILSGCTGGGMMEASCGCETAGCTGGCLGGGLLNGSLLEASCGCEDAGCSGSGLSEPSCGCEATACTSGCATAPALEASCGCESTGCSGGCGISMGDGCTGSGGMPCKGRNIFSGFGDLLFGRSCGHGACGCTEDVSCGVEEASCGCEAAGCPSGCASTNAIRQPQGQVVSAEEPLKSRLLTKRILPKPTRTAVATPTQRRAIQFAGGGGHSSVEQVGFESRIQQPVRFMSDRK